MDIQRKEFEKWYFNENYKDTTACKLKVFEVLSGLVGVESPYNGTYLNYNVQTSWKVWQQAQKVVVPEWISLEDVEPNIGETVLICWSDGFDVEPEKDFMDVDIDSGVHYWSNFENDEPTHWMPIPQPPKAQEQVG